MDEMTVTLRVTDMLSDRVLWVTVLVEDSPRGLNESRNLGHHMGTAMGVMVDRVDVHLVEL